MHKLLISLVGLAFTGMVSATPPSLTTVGEGSYRFLFWQLYDARLASHNGKFSDYQQSKPFMLQLTYKREISKDEFIEATVEQWQKLGTVSDKQQTEWAGSLSELWRDVKEGDRLTALMTEQEQVQFYFNDTDIGTVTDKDFAPAFFDIWLHPDTTAPDLRRKLIAAE